MGDAQSAQREGKKDEAAEEESGKVDDAQAEQCSDNKLFKNNVQIHEINAKSGISIAEVNGLCEDEVAADAVLSPDEDISETEIPLGDEEEEEEEAPKDLVRNENECSNEVVVAEDVPLEMTEMDGKKNDINDGFRKFFSNIGLRLSIKRGSTDLLKDLPDETSNEERCDGAPVEIVVKETESEIPEQNKDANAAQGNHDNDSTTGPTMTDLTPEDAIENAEEKATEAKEEAGSDDAGETTPPDVQEAEQEVTPEGELQDSPEQEEVVSPIKKFFTTGIFSGLRKKRKPAEEETNEKEMVDMAKKDGEETEEEQQLDKEEIDPGVEASADEADHKENGHKQEMVSTTSPETTDEGKSSTTDPSTDIVPEPDIANAREKVPSSPLKRLLSGSSFRRLSKKPRSRRSSDSRLSDSGEHATDQLMSSTESAENQKEEAPVPPPSSEATGEEDSAWASFKKLLTPKKRRRAPSLGNKDTDAPADKPKSSEGEQVSDQSTDDDKKRKDSSHSWEAVLCGSGKKRSRKTSDSEDETPPNDNENKQESSNERKNSLVSSPRVRSDGEGPTTWITFRRLVTPKRKAKEEDDSKDIVQSDSEVSQDESSFSIKKLLPGRKKRKSTEKQDHVSSDEAEKDVPSGDEDSETPAVVPLSEFDTPESMVQIQTQAEIENHVGKESDYDVPEDLQELPEPVLPCDGAQTEGKTLEESEVKIKATTTAKPAKDEEVDDDSEDISKHQQLSDITEEGIITETMATPASVNEETGKDDTIAEDLLEITSEAITAPEPASVTTLADETEMISAVSQLSTESSKTSGNTTPVPAEYEVMETDALLQQVVETITTTPETVPVTSSNTKSENIVSSVLHQIFKTFVKEDKATAVLEIHKKTEAATITMGDAVKDLDDVKELAAAAQTEIIPEVNDTGPTEFIPEAFEKLETSQVSVGEVQEVSPESEASAEHVQEKIEGSITKAPQDEMENQRMEAASLEVEEEAEAQNVEPEKVDELARDENAQAQASKFDSDEEIEQLPEQEVKSVDIPPAEATIDEAERKDMPSEAAETDQIQDPEVNVEDTVIEASAVEEIFMSVDEGSVSLSCNEGTTEEVQDLASHIKESLEPIDSSTAEPIEEPEELKTEQTTLFNTEEPQQEMEILIEPENKTIPEDAAKNEQVLEAVQAPETHLEDGDGQLRHKEVEQEDVLVTDGLKEESIPLTEDSIELLKAEDDAAKNESAQEPEVLDTSQASQDSSVDNRLLPEEDKAKDVPPESAMDGGKQETEISVQPDEVKELEELPSIVDTGIETSTEDFFVSVDEGSVSLSAREVTLQQIDESKEIQEQEEIQTSQPLTMFSQLSSLLTFGKVTTKDIPVTDETQKETEVEAQEKLRDEESRTENVEEAGVLPSEVEDTAKDSTFDEPAVTESVDEDIAVEESLEPVESFKAEQFEEHEDLQPVQTSLIDTEGPQEEELVNEDVENVQEPEMLPSVVETEETLSEKEEAVLVPEIKESIEGISETVPLSGESLEPVDLSIADVQEQEEPQPVHKSLINTVGPQEEELVDEEVENVNVQEPETLPSVVENVSEETLIEKEEAVPPSEASLEPVDLSITDVQVQEEPQQVQETCSLLPLEEIVKDVPAVETTTEELQKETEVRADEQTEVEPDTSDSVKEAEDLPSTERDNVQETVSEESETIVVTEASDSMEEQGAPKTPTEPSPEPVDVSKTEDAQDREVLNTEEALLLDSEEGSLPFEKVKDEPQQETEARDEEPEVSLLNVEDTVKEEKVEQLEQPQVVPQEPEVLQSDVEVVEKEIEKDAEKVHVQEEPEPSEKVEADVVPLDSEVCQLSGPETEDITTPEMTTDELAPITVGGVEAETTGFVLEPKEPPPTPEDTDQETSNEGDTIQPAVVVDSVNEGSEIVSFAEKSPEVVDIARSEDKQELEEVSVEKEAETEEVTVEQEAESEPKVQSLQPFENVTSEEIPAAEKVTDKPQEETKVLDEPERELLSEAITTDYAQEKEEIPSSVKDTDLDTSAEEAVTIQEPVLTESIVEVFETTPHTAQSPEAVDVSGIRDVREPEVFNATQRLPLDSMAGELLLDTVIPENKSAVEIITDELQKELDVKVEPQEIPQVEANTCGTEQEAQSDPKASGLTSENVKSEDVETVESVTDESQKDTKDTIESVEELPALPDEAFETEIQEPEEPPSNVEDFERETFNEDTTIDMLVATGSIVESSVEIPVQAENDLITEQVQVQDKIPTDQDSLESSLPLDKAIPEDKLAEETVMEEPQNEIYYSIELHDQRPIVAETSENVQVTDTLPSSEIQETSTEDDTTTHVPEEKEGKGEVEAPIPTTEESPETVGGSEKKDVQEPEVLNTTQELQLDSNMSSQLPLENVAVETAIDEPTEETEVRDEEPEVLDVGDTAKDSMTEEGVCTDVDVVTEGPEQGSEQILVIEESLEPGGARISPSFELQIEKMSSEDNQVVETVTDEHIQETEVKAEALEEQPFEATQNENDQEAEAPPSDSEGYMKETETEGCISDSEEDAVGKPQEQIQQEDVSKPDLDNAITAITDHIQSDVTTQLNHNIDVTEACEIESNQQVVQVELKDLTPEVAEELATKPQDQVASVDEELNNSQVLENIMILEEIQAPSVDDVAIIDESKHEVPLSAVQVTVEEEKERDETSTKAASLMHAIVPDVVTCFFKKVSATVRDVLPERTSDSAEPRLDSDELAEAGEQDSVAQMINVQSVECEDDHQLQEQVVDTEIKSMEAIVDKTPEIEETEMKEVTEVHRATIQEEDILSEHPDTKKGITGEETPMTIEEDVHVKENLPETVSESAVEQHVMQPVDAGEVCELPESESDQKEHQEVIDAAAGTLKEIEDEAPVVVSEDPATSQQVSEDVDQTLLLDETKAEEVKSAEEVIPLPEESDVKKVQEPEQSTKSAQNPLAMPSDTRLVVPQNAGFISSTGNFESPSSLSLEFKLNIQFGQAKAQLPPSPTAEPMKKKDVSEVGVQAAVPPKPVEPTTPMQQGEEQKNMDLAVVKDQPVDLASSMLTLASTAVITTHPVQMNFGHLSMEAVEPVTTPQPPQPSTPEGAEPLIDKDVAEIQVQAMESDEQATQRFDGQKQTEIMEGQDQLVEISEPVLLQGPTEEESEISKVATHAAEPVEQESKVPEEVQEQLGALNVEQSEVKDQPTEIITTEPEATLELTEKAVITSQPEVTDDGICASETEERVAEVEGSPHLQNDVIEQLTSTDPANVSQRAGSQTEPTEVNVCQSEIKEQMKDFYEEASAVIITQPVLWDFAMCTAETVEPGLKELAPPLQISGIVEVSGEDVSKEANNQSEPEEPSDSTEGVELRTHPVLLDIGLQESEIEEPVVVKEPSSPLPITEEIELPKLTDVLEIGGKAEEEVVDLKQGAVDVQPIEITEPVLPSDFTEGVLLVTQPEVMEVALQANETAQEESKAPASPLAEMESAKALTAPEISNGTEEPLTPTQTAEEQKETELPEIDVQETEITEPEEQESAPEITEGAVITTHPMLLDLSIHATQTVDPVENAPESSTTTSADIEPLKETDVLESDIMAKKEESQKQSEVPETSLQVTEITEPEVNFDLSQVAVITTQPVLLDDGLYAIKTVELDVEDAEDEEDNLVEKVTSSVQTPETIPPVSQTEKEEEFSSVQETKVTKEHVHNQEEENDQDVWLDAEEGDYTQEETEMSFVEVEEHLESVEETMPEEEEVRFEEEAEIDPDVQTEEEEVQKEDYKTGEVCEIESEGEGEDFAIALEHQEYAAASVTTVEWD